MHTNIYYYVHILIPFFTSYTFYNASRRSFADSSPRLLADNKITEAQYATVNASTSILYGVAKYGTSILLNSINPKTTYLFGLFMSSIVVFISGLFLEYDQISAYLITWVITTLFYGFCWPSIAYMVRLWVPSSVRGIVWSFMNITTSSGAIVGNLLMKSLSSYPIYHRYTLIGISTLLFVPYCYSIIPSKGDISEESEYDSKLSQSTTPSSHDNLNKSPSKVSLLEDEIDSEQNIMTETDSNTSDITIPVEDSNSERLHAYDYMYIQLVLTSIVTAITYMTRYTLAEWGHIIHPKLHTDLPSSVLLKAITYYETGGIIGTVAVGYISDTYKISRITLCCLTTLFCCAFVYFLSMSLNSFFFVIFNILIGVCIYVPFSFIELITIELVPATKANRIGAINNIVQQIGCLLSAIPIQHLISKFGYDIVFPFLSCLLFISFVSLLILMHLNSQNILIKKE